MNTSINIIHDQLSAARTALLGAAGTQKTGAQLRALIDAACPEFDVRGLAGVPVGPGALTKVLKEHFSDIVQPIGRKGGDTLFLIGLSGRTSTSGDAVKSISLWAAFASPGLGQELMFDRRTHHLTVRAPEASFSADHVRIPSLSRHEFKKIAEDFLATTETDTQKEFQSLLGSGDFYYHTWISALKARGTTIYHRWGLFRVQAIIELFRNRLASAGVSSEQAEEAAQTLIADQAAAYKERTRVIRSGLEPWERTVSQRENPRPPVPEIVTESAPDLKDARAVAVAALNHMSISEIRHITLPLGAIIDAVLFVRK